MAQPLRATVKLTAVNVDALSGTDLERAPGPGVLSIHVASTVDTATLTAVVGGANVVRSQAIPLRTSGLPNLSDDPPAVLMVVAGGEKIVINVGGTTGTVFVVASFAGEA